MNQKRNEKRVICLMERSTHSRLSNYIKNNRTIDGFEIRIGEFTDIAINEKLDKMEQLIKSTRRRKR
jgi:hypothetical protein